MSLRPPAAAAGLLGGACWLVRGFLPGAALFWTGLALLGVCLALVGAGLVKRSAGWLRMVVAVALPLLAWSVLAVVHDERGGEAPVLDAVLGAAVLVAAVVVLSRSLVARPEPGAGRRRSHGSHAR